MADIGGAIGTRLASVLVASPVLKGAVRPTAFESGVDRQIALLRVLHEDALQNY